MMIIYTLDSLYEKNEVIDEFESFIWTERYCAYGDFELVSTPTIKMRSLLKMGTFLSIIESERVMIVESVDIKVIDGKNKLTAKGRSMESILDYRALRAPGHPWYVMNTVGDIAEDIVWRVCVVANAFSPNDIIPNLYVENLSGNTGIIETTVKFQSVYSAVKELCESADVGFRITKRGSSLIYASYVGEFKPDAIFSTAIDTLYNPSYLLSQVNYRNIAYVYGKNSDLVIVAAPGTPLDIQGFDRRVLSLDASDIEPIYDDAPANQYIADSYLVMLKQRGIEALATCNSVAAFDGMIPRETKYLYGRDYQVGDIVVLGDGYGAVRKARVTEHIWSSNSDGDLAYPTFESERLVDVEFEHIPPILIPNP